MQSAGRPIHADDLPPALAWESAVWWLYLRVQTQWRLDPMGRRIGLDYNPAIAIIRAMKWSVPETLELLQVIERAAISAGSEDGDE